MRNNKIICIEPVFFVVCVAFVVLLTTYLAPIGVEAAHATAHKRTVVSTHHRDQDLAPKQVLAEKKRTGPTFEYQVIPGVTAPTFDGEAAARVGKEAVVIGVVVKGAAYAFAEDALLFPGHVVNMYLDQVPISVTFCDRSGCSRVLTSIGEAAGPIDLNVGGIDINEQMLLLFEGNRYLQSSPEIPLADYPFVVTRLGSWLEEHPHSHVFGG